MSGRTIVNPLFRDTVHFIETAAETNGKYSQMEVVLMPGGGNPPHVHNVFTETFAPVKGILGLKLGRKKIYLMPGESYKVKTGEVHNFFNPSNKPVTFQLKFFPGHAGMENMLRIVYGLAADGLTNKKGLPKSILVSALIMKMSDSYPTGILSLLRPFLSFLAKRAQKKGIEKQLFDKYCS